MEIAVARPIDWGRIWKWLLGLLGVMLMSIFIVRGATSTVDGSPPQELACSGMGYYNDAGNAAADGNCVCSEPMAGTEGGGWINDGHDFADSPDATECFGNRSGTQTFQTDASDEMAMVTVTAWGDVPRALNHTNGPYIWLNGTDITSGALAFDSTDRVICYRYYMQVDATYSPAGSTTQGSSGNCETVYSCPLADGQYNCRNKYMQMQWTTQGQVQTQEAAAGACPTNVGEHWEMTLTVTDQEDVSPAVKIGEDCDTAPCRIELCADGNLQAGTNIVHRARVYSIKTGVTGTNTQGPVTAGAASNPDTWGGDVFHSGPDGSDRIGYFMEARWDEDLDQWIGAACEIEGGC